MNTSIDAGVDLHATAPAHLLRMAAGLSRLGAWYVERDGMRLVWSDEVREIHEVAPDYQPTYQSAIGFLAPGSQPLIERALQDCMRDGTGFDLQLELVTGRGRRLWVRSMGEAVRGREGEVVMVRGAFQDISPIKQLADENLRLAQSLADTLGGMSDAFYTLGPDWRFTFMNARAEQLLQRRSADVVGQSVWEAFPATVGSVIETQYRRAREQGIQVSFAVYYNPLACWFEIRAHPTPGGLAVYFHDITEAVQMRERLLHANEALERRVDERTRELRALLAEMEATSYSLAHDLRAPVASIGGYSQVLAEVESQRLSPRGRNYLHKVRAAACRIDEMITGLLALAKLPRSGIERSEFDISATARQVLARLAAAHPGRSVRTVVERQLRTRGDRVLLQQVVENLLHNAWKFTGRTADACIEVGRQAQPDGSQAFYVRDNGAGFDMAYASRLFEVFNRQHRNDEFEGTGVGLATVRRIVACHGGRIWAEAAPGQGATFFFSLPDEQG